MRSVHLQTGEFYGNVSGKLDHDGFWLSEVEHSGERVIAEHSHESAYFTLLLQGEYSEWIGSKEFQYGMLTAAFHPLQEVHRGRVGQRGARFFTLEVEANCFEQIREITPRLELNSGFCGGELKWLLSRLYFLNRDAAGRSPIGIEQLSLEILAKLAKAGEWNETRRPNWMARVEEFLRAEIHRNVTLKEVAREAGIHPVHLSRVFRRIHRQSLDAYVNRIRIRRASEALCRDTSPLAEIAIVHGFADQSHFTRVFRKVTGSTPAAFRRALQGKSANR
jgi:AraC family transcriptional regulator